MTAPQLKIAIASSEVFPFAKTGGLADVTGTLPLELARLGHRTVVFLPAYQSVTQNSQFNFEVVYEQLQIPVGKKLVTGSVLKSQLPNIKSIETPHTDSEVSARDAHVDVYLIQQSEYFGRPGIYGENGRDYADNCERFSFFCRAVLETIRQLQLSIDVIHANDWQTGLIPAYLKTEYEAVPPFENIPAIFTIHNLAYQGRFRESDMAVTGLDWKYFNWQQLEFHDDISLLKAGIVFADQITTVSPRYAMEIQSEELGCGMEGVLRDRSESLTGIMNGIDANVWNPQTDLHLAQKFSVDDWQTGKRACKIDLQQRVGLEQNAEIPLIGLVGRLASQKGWSILLPVIDRWLSNVNVQWIVLGTGDPNYENALRRLTDQHPHRLSVCLKFSDAMAHQIEAGSDIFLMPSQYEPCGLNQLYSLRYGTVPVVRETGGLADSIETATTQSLADKTANGFTFESFNSHELEQALALAVTCYGEHREEWNQIVETGMRQDWTWRQSATRYVEVYQQAILAANSTSQQPG